GRQQRWAWSGRGFAGQPQGCSRADRAVRSFPGHAPFIADPSPREKFKSVDTIATSYHVRPRRPSPSRLVPEWTPNPTRMFARAGGFLVHPEVACANSTLTQVVVYSHAADFTPPGHTSSHGSPGSSA